MTPLAGLLVGLAYGLFGGVGIVLAVIDARTRRLPDRIVIPLILALLALLTAASVVGAPWEALGRGIAGGALLFAVFLGLRIARPAAMGGGDVKLAGAVGTVLAYPGWSVLAAGALAAFVCGGVYGLVLVTARRARRDTAIPFGPFMILGAGLALGGWALLVT